MLSVNGINYVPEEVLKRTATDLGMTLVRETMLTIQIEGLLAEKAALDEQLESLRTRLIGYETDIDNLRAQVGAKPKVRPHLKR